MVHAASRSHSRPPTDPWHHLLSMAAVALACTLVSAGCSRKPCARDCEWSGLCTEHPGGDGSCLAAKDADCHPSKACRFYGKCTAAGGACVRRSVADCKRSNKCLWAGECGFKDGNCTAVSAADCHGSKYCKDKGMCQLKRKYGGLATCVK